MDTGDILFALEDETSSEEIRKDILNNVRVFTDEFGKTYDVVRLGDISVPAAMIRRPGNRLVRDSRKMQLREDDIFLVSFPKTGTHWVANILRFLLKTGPLEDEYSTQAAFFEYIYNSELERLPSPRVLATHQTPELLPADTFRKGRKMFLLYRNPKDAAVSLFYFLQKERIMGDGLGISWNCFVDLFMNGDILLFGFFEFYKRWIRFIEETKDFEILVVKYEDLIQDKLNQVRRISRFLGFDHNDEKLLQILEKCSFENLRNDVNSKKYKTPTVDENGQSIIYRKGIAGDWKNMFTVAQSERMDDLIAKHLKNNDVLQFE